MDAFRMPEGTNDPAAMTPEGYGERAVDAFYEGYNCAQSVVKAFADDPKVRALGLSEEKLLALASSFGGGMGRLREVCGAVSAMFMIDGLLEGYGTPETGDVKKAHYERIQALAAAFKERHETIICRELLGLPEGASDPAPAPRTDRYYDTRPCPKLIRSAAEILAKQLYSP